MLLNTCFNIDRGKIFKQATKNLKSEWKIYDRMIINKQYLAKGTKKLS